MTYYILSWHNHMVLAQTDNLAQAKRIARGKGFETIYGAKVALAYVATREDRGCYYVVYNPRFRL